MNWKQLIPELKPVALLSLSISMALATDALGAQTAPQNKARVAIEQAIEAMGGQAFSKVRDIQTEGRYFPFKDGRSLGLVRYLDYTRIPDRSRFQLGLGKNAQIFVHNLELGKGWIQEGKDEIQEISETELKEFRRNIKHTLELVFRTRYKDPEVKLFYFGPEELSGGGEAMEAVELLDAENVSTLVYLDRTTHLPVRLEYTTLNKMGVKLKEEVEYSNWQVVEGVKVPFNVQMTVDNQTSSQTFIEKITFSAPIPESFFQKPVPKK